VNVEGREVGKDRKHLFIPLVMVLACLVFLVSACSEITRASTVTLAQSGDPQRGVQAFVDYGCISCHRIPGVPRARGNVGPPLNSWANRTFIAGQFPNTEENLWSWLMAPQAMMPGSAMPDMGVTWQDAQDMSAYLFSLVEDRNY
jgi:cytochrome c